MFVLSQNDIKDTRTKENISNISDILYSGIPKKIINEYLSDPIEIETIQDIEKLIKKVQKSETISKNDFNKLKNIIFTSTFKEFYKSSIVYKESISGILIDWSVNIKAKQLQDELNNYKKIKEDFYNMCIISLLRNEYEWWEIENIKIDWIEYRIIKQEGSIVFLRFMKKHNNVVEWENIANGSKNCFSHKDGKIFTYWKIENISDFWDILSVKNNIYTQIIITTWESESCIFDISMNHKEYELIESNRNPNFIGWYYVKSHPLRWDYIQLIGKNKKNKIIKNRHPDIGKIRSLRKKESKKYISWFEYHKNNNQIIIQYAKISLYRKSDFLENSVKIENFNYWRNKSEECIWDTYTILNLNPEIIQL